MPPSSKIRANFGVFKLKIQLSGAVLRELREKNNLKYLKLPGTKLSWGGGTGSGRKVGTVVG